MADVYNMEGHKLYWHIDRVKAWLDGEPIAPLYIDMGITQTCNIHCSYCYYAVPENRTKATIPTHDLVRFLQEAAEVGVKAVGFLGDGEPMVHKGVYDAVEAGAKAGLDMAISTNGTILDETRALEFLKSLSWIRFNISAATPEKYAVVMGTKPDIFDKVRRNIAYCTELKRRHNLPVTIGIQMVLVQECASDIVQFGKMGRDLGVDYAVIKQCSHHGTFGFGLPVEDYDRYEGLFKSAESYSNDSYNVIVKRTKMAAKGHAYDQCHGCAFLPQITGAGEMYICGNFFGEERYLLGDITKQSFKEIVGSDHYRAVLKRATEEVDVHSQCGLGCRQNEINEYLWALKNPPKHLNFI